MGTACCHEEKYPQQKAKTADCGHEDRIELEYPLKGAGRQSQRWYRCGRQENVCREFSVVNKK